MIRRVHNPRETGSLILVAVILMGMISLTLLATLRAVNASLKLVKTLDNVEAERANLYFWDSYMNNIETCTSLTMLSADNPGISGDQSYDAPLYTGPATNFRSVLNPEKDKCNAPPHSSCSSSDTSSDGTHLCWDHVRQVKVETNVVDYVHPSGWRINLLSADPTDPGPSNPSARYDTTKAFVFNQQQIVEYGYSQMEMIVYSYLPDPAEPVVPGVSCDGVGCKRRWRASFALFADPPDAPAPPHKAVQCFGYFSPAHMCVWLGWRWDVSEQRCINIGGTANPKWIN